MLVVIACDVDGPYIPVTYRHAWTVFSDYCLAGPCGSRALDNGQGEDIDAVYYWFFSVIWGMFVPLSVAKKVRSLGFFERVKR